MNNGNSQFIQRPPVLGRKTQVTITVQVNVPVAAALAGTEITEAMTGGNKSLYEVVNRQCSILTQSFEGECRLVQLTTSGNMNGRMAGPPGLAITTSATATYEIDAAVPPQAPAAAR